MIRVGNQFDNEQIIELLRHYRDACPYDLLKEANDKEYINHLLNTIHAGLGVILVSEKENKIVGVCIAMIFNNIWNKKLTELAELVYWVEPEYRGSSIGYRLFKEYCAYGDTLKKLNRIGFYSISKMVNSPDLKYEKFGFNKLEEKWIR